MTAESWTDADIPNLTGRTAIVTGANSGIGYEATQLLAANGADVVLAVRDNQRGEAAADRIDADVPGSLSVRTLDLADLDSVETFVSEIKAAHDTLDFLFNNAGVMAIPRSETADGFETQFGVNHLGHFALTAHLLEPLEAAEGESRIITQSSGMHERGTIDFDDLQHEDSYDRWNAYAQSKLANVCFAYELQRRLDEAAIEGVTSVATHPGYADTNLQRRGPEQDGSKLRLVVMQLANRLFAQSARAGAWPMLYAATEPALTGGEYVGPTGVLNMRGTPGVQDSSARSYNQAVAQRLWTVSQNLTGIEFAFD